VDDVSSTEMIQPGYRRRKPDHGDVGRKMVPGTGECDSGVLFPVAVGVSPGVQEQVLGSEFPRDAGDAKQLWLHIQSSRAGSARAGREREWVGRRIYVVTRAALKIAHRWR
jgi:hypothetical protein